MNTNEKYFVKEYKLDNPLIIKIDSVLGNCYRNCHNICFHESKNECINVIKLTNIFHKETISLTISDKSRIVFDSKKKLTIARQNGFIFIQKNKLTVKNYSRLRYLNICFYLNFQTPMCRRQFFRVFSQNRAFVENVFNDMENLFQFACQKWFNQINITQ